MLCIEELDMNQYEVMNMLFHTLCATGYRSRCWELWNGMFGYIEMHAN